MHSFIWPPQVHCQSVGNTDFTDLRLQWNKRFAGGGGVMKKWKALERTANRQLHAFIAVQYKPSAGRYCIAY